MRGLGGRADHFSAATQCAAQIPRPVVSLWFQNQGAASLDTALHICAPYYCTHVQGSREKGEGPEARLRSGTEIRHAGGQQEQEVL